jgi:hypothetical protein
MAYTNIDDPSAYFQTTLYTGTGAAHSIGNDGNSDLKPDWVWIKKRSASGNHSVFDSTRGVYEELITNGTNAEASDVQLLTQFDTDGFTVGTNSGVNGSGATFVGWQWKANGGTTSSNTDGDITSTVQANTDAGFSIVTYTGNGSANQTIGHGLGAVPKMILFKNRSNTAYWYVYHVATGNDTMTYLNLTNAAQSLPSQFSTPTTTTFNVSNENSTFDGYNSSGQTYVAYVFAEKQGFSQFGKYRGNQDSNGMMCYCSFRPAWVMIKKASGTGPWNIFDSKRDGYNIDYLPTLQADSDGAEFANVLQSIDILSNGFKIRTNQADINQSNQQYIYMAFAENPFVTSTGIPATAR